MKFRLSFILMVLLANLTAQGRPHDVKSQDHDHEHPRNEIGIVNAPVYLVKEKAMAYSLHLHYIHMLENSKFGLGLGYERIFNEHNHNVFSIVGAYRPIDQLSISLAPGLTFEDEHPSELNFALHVETAYEFEIGNFHIGPALGLAYDPEDYHISLGFHFAYGF